MNVWLLKKRSLSSNVVVFGDTAVQHQQQRNHNILNNLHNVQIDLRGPDCIGPLSSPADQNNEKGANL
ncbi:hypothetical protein niasHT_019141 [Heterodera trifolii]|uniref:Uncharacterized protein n=1 Tax=Heterodera trifolii TaxID=157864 RepID=A0ABD2KWS2_9BILA